MVQQRHTALLGLGLRELQQCLDLEAIGVPRVAALRGAGWAVSAIEASGEGSGGWEAGGDGTSWGGPTYIVEEVSNFEDQLAKDGQPVAVEQACGRAPGLRGEGAAGV